MRLKKIASSLIIVSGLSFSNVASAGVPVVDFPQTGRDISHYISEIGKWVSQIQAMQNQLNTMIGSRGMGGQLNSYSNKILRKQLPQNWRNAMDAVNTSSASVGQLRSAITRIKGELAQFKTSNVYADVTTKEAKEYDSKRNRVILAMAVAEKTFNNNRARLAEIEGLMAQIDNSSVNKDAKAATDLNSRINAQTGLLALQQIELQSAMLQQVTEANNLRNEERAKFINSTRANSSIFD